MVAALAAALAIGSASTASAHLLHQYSFNALTPADSIGTAHATLVGPAFISNGAVNTSGGGYVSLPAGASAGITSDFTIEMWVNWRGGASSQAILVAAGSTPVAVAIRTSATIGTTIDIPSAGLHAVTGQIATGRPNQIVLVYSEGRPGFSCYIDGSLHVQAPILRPIFNLANITANGVDLGGSAAPGENSFNGTIDQVRIYNHALSDAGVRSNWTLGPDACTPPTVLSELGDEHTTCVGGTAGWTLSVWDPEGNDYQWQRQTGASFDQWENLSDGPAPGVGEYVGTSTRMLTILGAAPYARERFRCAISNPCGQAVSDPHEFSTCRANFNCHGVADTTDLELYLAAWFAGDERANFNDEPGVTVQDLFDFLAAWFRRCV